LSQPVKRLVPYAVSVCASAATFALTALRISRTRSGG
jgi:hypothetical protein